MLQEYQQIKAKLQEAMGPFELPLPALHASTELKLATLKRYEDAIDALICCWVGTLYAEGRARPLGDDTGAIWCPRQRERRLWVGSICFCGRCKEWEDYRVNSKRWTFPQGGKIQCVTHALEALT